VALKLLVNDHEQLDVIEPMQNASTIDDGNTRLTRKTMLQFAVINHSIKTSSLPR
jgi:hypothetical protein